MTDELKTIREAWETLLTNLDHAVTAGAWRVAEGSQTWDAVQEAKQALTALSELERMAGEPVAAVRVLNGRLNGTRGLPGMQSLPDGDHEMFAAPPAQQQYEAADMASAAAQGFRDGVASVAQQPQAEAVPQSAEFCWLVEHFDIAGKSTGHYCTGKLGIADRVLTTMDPLQAKRYDTWRAANIASVKLGSTMSGTWRAMQHGFHVAAQGEKP